MNTDRFLYKGMTVNGEWVYGYLSVVTKEQKAKVEPGFYISNKMGMPFAYDVRPETVGQCTGVKDKNGKLIFEGDFVKVVGGGMFEHEMTFEVVDGISRWQIRNCGNYKHYNKYHDLDIGSMFEIIGNVHEMEVPQ